MVRLWVDSASVWTIPSKERGVLYIDTAIVVADSIVDCCAKSSRVRFLDSGGISLSERVLDADNLRTTRTWKR